MFAYKEKLLARKGGENKMLALKAKSSVSGGVALSIN